jgi:hypothetical protein
MTLDHHHPLSVLRKEHLPLVTRALVVRDCNVIEDGTARQRREILTRMCCVVYIVPTNLDTCCHSSGASLPFNGPAEHDDAPPHRAARVTGASTRKLR